MLCAQLFLGSSDFRVLRLQTQVLMTCGECFYPLSHLPSPKQLLKDKLLGFVFFIEMVFLCVALAVRALVDHAGTGWTRLASNSEHFSAS